MDDRDSGRNGGPALSQAGLEKRVWAVGAMPTSKEFGSCKSAFRNASIARHHRQIARFNRSEEPLLRKETNPSIGNCRNTHTADFRRLKISGLRANRVWEEFAGGVLRQYRFLEGSEGGYYA